MAGSAVVWAAAQYSARRQSWNRGWWLLWPSQRASVDMMEGRALIRGSVDVTQPGGIAWEASLDTFLRAAFSHWR